MYETYMKNIRHMPCHMSSHIWHISPLPARPLDPGPALWAHMKTIYYMTPNPGS